MTVQTPVRSRPGLAPFEDHPDSAAKVRFLRALEVGAFYPAARFERDAGVRAAEREGYVYWDSAAGETTRGDFSATLRCEASCYRLTDAGRTLLRAYDARPGTRSALGTVLSRLRALMEAREEAAEHSMAPEFEPDPFEGALLDAPGILWECGWDAVSLALEVEERLDGRWDHYRGERLGELARGLSPYCWPAITAARAAGGDARGAFRHLDVLREDGPGGISGRRLRDYLMPETVRVLDAAYDVWNPCTPAEMFRVLRGAGLLPAGGILARDPSYPRGRAAWTVCCSSPVPLPRPGFPTSCPDCGSTLAAEASR